MLRITRLVLDDDVVVQNWGNLTQYMVKGAGDRLMIKRKLKDSDFHDAVLETLLFWTASDVEANLSKFGDILTENGFQPFAAKVEEEFKKMQGPPKPRNPEPTTRAPVGQSTGKVNRPQRSGKEDYKQEVTSSLQEIVNNVGNIHQLLVLLLTENVIQPNEFELVQSKPTDRKSVV